MDNKASYRELNQLYLKGDLKSFQEKYNSLPHPDEKIMLLSIKVLKEASAWSQLLHTVSELKKSKTEDYRIKGELYEAFFSFLLEKQSRQNAIKVTSHCKLISEKYPESEIDFFAKRIHISTEIALLALGLSDADKKKQIVELGLSYFQKYQSVYREEALTLIDALIGHILNSPNSDPQLALQILDKYLNIPSDKNQQEFLVARMYLHYAKALLRLNHLDREHLNSPDSLPPSLLSLKNVFQQLNFLAGEILIDSLYGGHLLKLEYLEGIKWLEESITPLRDLGFEHLAFDNKTQIINWTNQRGFLAKSMLFEEKYVNITKAELAPFELKLKKLHDAHQLFSRSEYNANQEFLAFANSSEESETFKVSFTLLEVNSSAKLRSNLRPLEKLLDEQIVSLKPINNSILLAQLFLFKAQLKLDSHFQSYQTAIELFKKTGFTDEFVSHSINFSYDIVKERYDANHSFLIDKEVTERFQTSLDVLNSKQFIVNRYSLLGTLYQRWGIVQMLNSSIEKANNAFRLSGEYYLKANNLLQYAINVNHLSFTFIKLGRASKNIDNYNIAIQPLEEAINLIDKTELINFSWRLNFNMSLVLSEPLKYNLIIDKDEHNKRFYEAEHSYNKTLEIYSLILKRNNLASKSQKILTYGHLNKEIRQLIFAGFYFFFFEQQWEKCIFWLEKVRAKTLLSAITDKISPNQEIVNHKLIVQEAVLKEKITSTSDILSKRKLKNDLEHLYDKMQKDNLLKVYAGKKQEHIPDYATVIKGLRAEEKISQKNITFIYFYSHADEIHVFGIRSNDTVPLYTKIHQLSASNLQNELSKSYTLLLKSYHLAKPKERFWLKYSSLIAPIKEWTSPDDIICIIPYGFLHDLPYHALQIDGKALITRNPIFYNSSLSSWEYLRQKNSTFSLLSKPSVLANPESNLQHSLYEADLIGKLLEVRPYKESQVTKSQFLSSINDSSLIHFAGHGFYDNSDGTESALRLYSGEKVTVEEIMNQNINANLVVLSACNTGLHRNHPGEERAGLVTALLAAGAKSVIASLWPVTDKDAKNFYSIFYPKLKSGTPKVIALQETMIELMKNEERHEFYHWGAFVLNGYWG